MEVDQAYHLSWADLPTEPLLRTFSFLSVKDLVSCNKVNHHWRNASEQNELWKTHFRDWFSVRDEKLSSPSESFKTSFEKHYITWKRYRYVYAKVRNIWNQLEQILSAKAPNILETLRPGATEEDLNNIEQELNFKFDDEFRCFYRIHNGQNISKKTCGMFGGYEFYDFKVNLYLLPVQKFDLYDHDNPPEEWMKFAVPILMSVGTGEKYVFYMAEDFGKLKKGNIVEHCVDFSSTFLMHESIYDLFSNLVTNLRSENWEISKSGTISRYPSKNIPSETTRGVTIECSPLFIAERSNPRTPQYFFAYRIRMRMESSYSSSGWCKLLNRHWIITSANHSEHVRGPGVIGYFPEMFPGAFFEYASCCPIQTLTGSMKGEFQMKTKEGTVFDAIVPEFLFVAPSSMN